jgi:hypothetical protein
VFPMRYGLISLLIKFSLRSINSILYAVMLRKHECCFSPLMQFVCSMKRRLFNGRTLTVQNAASNCMQYIQARLPSGAGLALCRC